MIGRRHTRSRYGAGTLCGQAFKPVPLAHAVLCNSRPVRRNRDTRSRNTTNATPDGYHAPMVWSDPLSLATTHGVSLPAGTEMFHFPAYPPEQQGSVPAHDGRRVAPFGNPRIEAMLEAPRGLSHPQTSFIGTVCQGIHHTPFRAAHAPKKPNDSFKRQTTNHHTVKNDHKTIDLETRLQKTKPGEIAIKQTMTITSSHCSRPLSSSQTTTRPDRTRPAARKADGVPARGIRKTARTQNGCGWRSGNPKAYPYHSPPAPRTREANDLFHTSTPTRTREPSPAHGPHDGRQTGVLKNSVERR